MIETVVNIIQLIITGACSGIALFNAVRTEHRAWTLVGLFSGIFFMGDLYWLLFLLFYGETPPYSFIPYMSWYASYLFMLLLLVTVKGDSQETCQAYTDPGHVIYCFNVPVLYDFR